MYLTEAVAPPPAQLTAPLQARSPLPASGTMGGMRVPRHPALQILSAFGLLILCGLLAAGADAVGLPEGFSVVIGGIGGVLAFLLLNGLVVYHGIRLILRVMRTRRERNQFKGQPRAAHTAAATAAYTFNPPPGWTHPPAGWLPAPGWEPERSWPKPPEGWVLWQRTTPRPAPPQRHSPWDPDPAAGRIAHLIDPGRIAERLNTVGGRVSLAAEVMQTQLTMIEQRIEFDTEHKSGGSNRSQWHPLEWSVRHAALAGQATAADLARRIVGSVKSADELLDDEHLEAQLQDVPVDAQLQPLDPDEVISRWRTLYAWVDELLDAMADRVGVSRDEMSRRAAPIPDRIVPTITADGDSWQQAEHVAALALQHFGFPDARVTGPGTDGGLDVTGRSVAAQVKYTSVPVGRPVIQQLVGASGGRQTAFFSRSGYSSHAIAEANRHGMALFKLTLPSTVTPVNAAASELTS